MEDSISSWIAQNKDSAEAFSIKINEIHSEFVKLEIGGYTIQIIVPPNFRDASHLNSDSSDSTFVALHSEEEERLLEDNLNEVLSILNEKLERVRIGDNCLVNVLDSTLQVFKRYVCKKRPKIMEFKDQGGKSSQLKASYLYKAAEEARLECQTALAKVDEKSIAEGERILPWCSVSMDLNLGTVGLEMAMEGIVASDNVAQALGFFFDRPLEITLGFKSGLWLVEDELKLPPDWFKAMEVSVSSDQVGISAQKVPDEWDEKMRITLSKWCFCGISQYGPQVLVPDLVREFSSCYTGKGVDDGLLHGLGQVEQSNNIFVRLLIFIGTRLSTLGSWCCNCKKELPTLSRAWYCDAELCLFRHEELGVGTSVLQELQNTELVELEISLAAAASAGGRDVFEPYPTFLLKEREIRGRSGYFGTGITSAEFLQTSQQHVKMQVHADVEPLYQWDNKKLHVLMLVINSLPPVAEMQICENEYELRLMLSTSLQKLLNNDKLYDNECLRQEFVKDLWLPYNVLRFVLFTNRLSLHLLKDELELQMPGSHYQFAVVYDSEREQFYEHCRATTGSFFAYHGSSATNWYSILRNGLKCLSGTPYMSHGMSFGQGIYFSKSLDVSIAYCRAYSGWTNEKSKKYNVIAICEIFSDPVIHAIHSPIVVPPDHVHSIVIRYLIVFSGSDLKSSTSISELHEHYKKVRANYLQNHDNQVLAMQKQRIAAFHRRRGSS